MINYVEECSIFLLYCYLAYVPISPLKGYSLWNTLSLHTPRATLEPLMQRKAGGGVYHGLVEKPWKGLLLRRPARFLKPEGGARQNWNPEDLQ